MKKNGIPVKRKQKTSGLLTKFGKQKVRGVTEQLEQSSAEDDVPRSLGEVMIHVRSEEGHAWEVELPSGATVGNLYDAVGGGMDHLLSFNGTVLADRSAPLAEVGISDIGSSTEAAVDSINIASFVWGKDNLDKMKPIFEAEFQCVTHPKGEVEVHRVFMQWDSQYKYGWKDGRDFITVGVMLTESGQWIRMPPSTYDADTIFSNFGYNGMESGDVVLRCSDFQHRSRTPGISSHSSKGSVV